MITKIRKRDGPTALEVMMKIARYTYPLENILQKHQPFC